MTEAPAISPQLRNLRRLAGLRAIEVAGQAGAIAVAPYLGLVLILLGLAGFAWALSAIWGNHTTVNPYKVASSLVTSGPFRYSRNPIYVSDWLVYVAVMLLMQTIWPLLLAPVVWGLMRYAVIAHEEIHLEAKFGAEYSAYKSRVQRWI